MQEYFGRFYRLPESTKIGIVNRIIENEKTPIVQPPPPDAPDAEGDTDGVMVTVTDGIDVGPGVVVGTAVGVGSAASGVTLTSFERP